MIIIEGPDGCGKTTLVKKVAKTLQGEGWRYVSAVMSRGPRDGMLIREEVKSVLSNEVQGHLGVEVFDRFYFSELIYSKVLGRPCAFTGYETDIYSQVIKALEIPVVLCLPPFEVVAKNWETRSDDVARVGVNLGRVWEDYNNLPPHFQEYRYDYSANEPQQFEGLMDRIHNHLVRREGRLNHG